MNEYDINVVTDIVYVALFGLNAAELRVTFGLPPAHEGDVDHDDLRDCMGTLALEALARVEGDCQQQMLIRQYTHRHMTLTGLEALTLAIANRYAEQYRQKARHQGVDLLTGKALVS